MATIEGLGGLRERAGEHLGYSAWRTVTAEQVAAFAEVTDDHQWIHVDAERAAAGPFGGRIAHGYLTLSMATALLSEVVELRGVTMAVNYGLNRVRFPAPVPVGSRLRLGVELAAVEEVSGGVQALLNLTFEIEGGAKPVCVADALFRYYA